MSDARVRELERRWRDSGALADRLAWQRARLRAGELTAEAGALLEALAAGLPEERLVLLAYLADPAAVEVMGDLVVELASFLGGFEAARVVLGDPIDAEEEVLAWAGGLAHWGRETAGRALAELLRPLIGLLDAPVPDQPDDPYGAEADWIAERRTVAADAGRAVVDALERRGAASPDEGLDAHDFEPLAQAVVEVAQHAARASRPQAAERTAADCRMAVLAAAAAWPDGGLPGLLAFARPGLRAWLLAGDDAPPRSRSGL